MANASKAQPLGPRPGRFWRYNYLIIAGAGYWALAVPVATSQLVTLWMMALSSDFQQSTANKIAELMTPVLGAFLVANSLAPEYKSGVGAVLACKPVSLTRVLAIRAGLGMLAALLLTLVTLTVCSVGLKPIEIWPPLLASIPSLFFLSSLALLFATIFRNPLGGFAVALGLWCFDFALGYYVHPLLSVQGMSTAVDGDVLAKLWPIGKAVQVVAGALLWYVHLRQMPRICRPPERRDVLKIAATCAAVMAIYCYSGAVTVLGYAYTHRANLPTRDVLWLRRYLSIFGPVPVARLFGPAFATYVYEPVLSESQTSAHSLRVDQLNAALERWPHSIWADGIAFALASEVDGVSPTEAPARYLAVADRYPQSPFAPRALMTVARRDDGNVSPDERLLAARRLISDYPNAREAEPAAATLETYFPQRVNAQDMLGAAGVAAKVAPPHLRPGWLLRAAQLELQMGRRAEALQHAREARKDALQLREEARSNSEAGTELRPHLPRIDGARVGADKLIQDMGEKP